MNKKFTLHLIENQHEEINKQKQIKHRDFFNITIVDTHIHHTAAMNCKQLLYFIKDKIRNEGDTTVYYSDKLNKSLTLNELCQKLGIKVEDISLDSLQVFAD